MSDERELSIKVVNGELRVRSYGVEVNGNRVEDLVRDELGEMTTRVDLEIKIKERPGLLQVENDFGGGGENNE